MIIRPNRSRPTTYVDAAYCYRPSSVVCLSVCRSVTAELFYIIAQTGLTGHRYADDTQLYISAPASSASTTVHQFVACVEAIDAWMRSNRLKMNADMTQLIWLGTKQQLDKLLITELSLLSAKVTFLYMVYDLRFLLDN